VPVLAVVLSKAVTLAPLCWLSSEPETSTRLPRKHPVGGNVRRAAAVAAHRHLVLAIHQRRGLDLEPRAPAQAQALAVLGRLLGATEIEACPGVDSGCAAIRRRCRRSCCPAPRGAARSHPAAPRDMPPCIGLLEIELVDLFLACAPTVIATDVPGALATDRSVDARRDLRVGVAGQGDSGWPSSSVSSWRSLRRCS